MWSLVACSLSALTRGLLFRWGTVRGWTERGGQAPARAACDQCRGGQQRHAANRQHQESYLAFLFREQDAFKDRRHGRALARLAEDRAVAPLWDRRKETLLPEDRGPPASDLARAAHRI
jgi:hypothetical protein